MVQKIAGYLDRPSLLSLRSTSRSLRAKSHYTFGEHFFRTLKFCLHPYSLQSLSDISDNPHLAKHVRHVAFSTDWVGLIDPLHDAEVKQAAEKGKNTSGHSKLGIRPMSMNELYASRERVDALRIAQALGKLPKLELVLLGDELEFDGASVRESWGHSRFRPFNCPFGYCKPDVRFGSLPTVFVMIAMALEQLPRRNIDICLSIGDKDRSFLTDIHTPPTWYTKKLHKSITMLQLQIPHEPGLDYVEYLSTTLKPLCHGATIQQLSVKVEPGIPGLNLPPLVGRDPRLDGLPLQHLKKLTLEKLQTRSGLLIELLQCHQHRLTHLSLIKCSLHSEGPIFINGMPMNPAHPSVLEDLRWHRVIVELQKMENLSYLRLSRLGSDPVIPDSLRDTEAYRPRLDEEMTLNATWPSKEDVTIGLNYLHLTYRTANELQVGIFPNDGGRRDFLNVRYANYKVDPYEYRWTDAEATALRHERNCRRNRGRDAHPPTFVDDEREFPTPEDPAAKAKAKARMNPRYPVKPKHTPELQASDFSHNFETAYTGGLQLPSFETPPAESAHAPPRPMDPYVPLYSHTRYGRPPYPNAPKADSASRKTGAPPTSARPSNAQEPEHPGLTLPSANSLPEEVCIGGLLQGRWKTVWVSAPRSLRAEKSSKQSK